MVRDENATAQGNGDAHKSRSLRIGVIHNGIHADDAFNARTDVTILRSVRTLPFSIFRCDVIIVLSQTDQALLLRLKKPLTWYLKLGGVLVLLGATTQGRRWLPICQWEQKFTLSVAFDSESVDGRLVFKNIPDADYLKYHSKYVGHGSLCISVAQGDKPLAWDNEDRVVMFVRRLSRGGILLATTLDPDYHTSVPVPGPAEEPVELTHRKAAHLLDNIVDWATWAASGTPMRGRRHLLGWLLSAGAVIAMVLFYSLPVVVFGYLTFTSASQDYVSTGRALAIIAFLGSLASIYSVLISFVTRKNE